MTSKTLAQLFADLGVVQSRSRPQCSNDTPFIESANTTLKDGPHFSDRFANIEQVRDFYRTFLAWCNGNHRHMGIGLLTPAGVHHGRVDERRAVCRAVLHTAYDAHRERFMCGLPEPSAITLTVSIKNPSLPTTPASHSDILSMFRLRSIKKFQPTRRAKNPAT